MKLPALKKLYLIGALGLAASAPAFSAAEAVARHVETRAVTVSYADLDLAKPAGIQTLYQRLRLAAKSVCGDRDLRFGDTARDWQRCHDSALQSAIARMGNPQLTAVYEDRHGGPGRVVIPVAGLP